MRHRSFGGALCVAMMMAGVLGSGGCGGAPAARGRVGDVTGAAAASGPVTTVRLRDFGVDVAAGSDGRAYVVVGTGRVIVVDPAAAAVMAEIGVDGEPYALAVTPDARRVYVADLRGQYVTVIDTATAAVKTRLPLGTRDRPRLRPSAAASRDGRRVYIGDTTDDHLVVVDTAADQIVKDLFLPMHPVGIDVSADGRTVYVVGCRLACTDGTLLTIDAATLQITRTLPLESVPSGLVVTPDGRQAYVANGLDGSVTSVALMSGAASAIPVGPEPVGIAIAPGGARVYVTSFQAGTLTTIDTRSDAVVATMPVGRSPRAVAVSADGRRAYVTHSTSILSIVDLAGVAR